MQTSPPQFIPNAVGPPSFGIRTSFSFPPTPDDWDRIRDVVRHLYVGEGRPLKDVQQIIRHQYDFKAT